MAKQKANNKFGGAFLPFPRWALKPLSGDSIAKAVLLQILMYMDPDTQMTTTSYPHIAEQVGVDRRTVIRAVRRLESVGVLVRRVRRGKDKHNNLSNLYWVRFDNPEIFEVVSAESLGVVTPESLGSVSSDTTPSVSSDTPLVSPVTPKQEHKKQEYKNKKNRTKRENYEGLEVDGRLK